jgi:hypothetical protein
MIVVVCALDADHHHLHWISPCVYPLVSDVHRCGIDDPTLQRSNICDPDNAISMAEGMHIDKYTNA